MFAVRLRAQSILFVVVLLFGGCTPSVRYNRTTTENSAERSKSRSAVSAKVVAPAVVNTKSHSTYNTDSSNTTKNKLERVVDSYIGVPYKFGGENRSGLDCSSFTQKVYDESFGYSLPRTTELQKKMGYEVSVSNAKSGDLIFFKRRNSFRVNHVGVFLENGRFAHSSTSRGVIYSNLNESYYKKNIAFVKRVRK